MGKEKTFRASPFDYMQGGRISQLGEQYGVDKSDYNVGYGREDGGQGRTYKGGREEYEDAIRQAAMSDYDTRRTMEAQAMSGKKKAQKYAEGGFNNIEDVIKANNMRERWHKNAGNGGSFSSASDFAGQTHRAVEREREKQTAAYDKTYAKTTDLNSLKDKLMAEATDKAASAAPIEPSDRMASVENRLEGAASNRPPSLYSKNNTDPAKADDQKDAARGFLSDFTADVREGAGIKSDIATGVSNAAKHVRDAYGR
jgi:hypothetical protein